MDVYLKLRGARQFNREVKASAAQLEAMGVRGAGAMGKFALQADKLKNFGRNMSTYVTLPVVAMGALSVKAASDWESAFAGVRKTVNATEPQFAMLDQTLRNMSMRIPVSASELAGIAEAAGQLGIQTKNIAGFTRVMADLGVATNLTSQDAAMSLAKFANVTQMPQSQFDRLGSVIVDLGNKMATTESEIVEMGTRFAGTGKLVGLSQSQIMSFAATLSSLNIKAESGGTALVQSFTEMNTAVMDGGEALQGWAKVAGMSAGQFSQAFKKDAAGAMVAFTEGLDKLKKGGGNVSAALDELGLTGIRVQNALIATAGAGDLLRKSLGLGKKAWQENNALSEEARKRYKTFQSRLQIFKNTMTNLGIVIGNTLLPPLTKFVTWLAPKLQSAAKRFQGLSESMKRTIFIGIGLLAIAGPLIWMLGGVAGGVGKILILLPKLIGMVKYVATAFQLLGGAGGASALLGAIGPAGWIALGIIALGAAFVIAYKKIKPFREAVDSAFGAIKKAVAPAVSDFKDGISDLVDSVKIIVEAFGPNGNLKVVTDFFKVVLPVVFEAAVGTIKRVFAGIGQQLRGFAQIFKGVMGLLKAILTGDFKKMWRSVKLIFSGAFNVLFGQLRVFTAGFRQVVSMLIKPFRAVWAGIKSGFNAVVSYVGGIPGRIASAASGMFDGIKEAFRSAINWIISKWNGLELKVGGQKIDLPDPLGSITIPEIGLGTPNIPLLAQGGTATRSGLSVVGDQGPELQYLPKAASVIPLRREVIREAVGGSDRPIHTHIYLKGREIAMAVSDQVADAGARA